MDWLEQILQNATITDNKLDVKSVMELAKKEFEKQAVNKTEYDNVKTQLDTANKTIKDLKKTHTDNEDLQKKIETHEKTIKDLTDNHKKEVETLKKKSAIENILLKNKAKHADLLRDKFDLEKIKIKEDGAVDLDNLTEQLKSMKETYKDMFDIDTTSNYTYVPTDSGFKNPTSDVDFVSIVKENQSKR